MTTRKQDTPRADRSRESSEWSVSQRGGNISDIAPRIVASWIMLVVLELLSFSAISEFPSWVAALGWSAGLAGFLLFAILDDSWVSALSRRRAIPIVVSIGTLCLFGWPLIIPTVRHALTTMHYLFLASGVGAFAGVALLFFRRRAQKQSLRRSRL